MNEKKIETISKLTKQIAMAVITGQVMQTIANFRHDIKVFKKKPTKLPNVTLIVAVATKIPRIEGSLKIECFQVFDILIN